VTRYTSRQLTSLPGWRNWSDSRHSKCRALWACGFESHTGHFQEEADAHVLVNIRLFVPKVTISDAEFPHEIGKWLHLDRSKRGECPGRKPPKCPRCDDRPLDQAAYSYLLGLYLGDGYIVHWSGHRTPSLVITCDNSWPGLMDECEQAMRAVFPDNAVCRSAKEGSTAPAKNTSTPSPSNPGSRKSSTLILGNSSAASSTPTAVASPTGRLASLRVNGSATSTPGTSSPTCRAASSVSSPRPWTRLESNGGMRTHATSPSPAKPP
jgi:hypothetical protein